MASNDAIDTNSLDRETTLSSMNRDIPQGVDWKQGARTYVAACIRNQGREDIELYSMKKPLCPVGRDDPGPVIEELVHYLNTFTNAIGLVRPKYGDRILDVACGGGWVSHYLSSMGYWTYGIDISEDFIDLARQRLSSDPYLSVSATDAQDRFAVLDIEDHRMPEHLRGTFDFIWLESCLHHFVDPISALQNLAEALKPDGVLILIEFENRVGGIKPEYMAVMREYDTLERPFARHELLSALGMAGFRDHQFVASVNGWFAPDDPATAHLGQSTIDRADDLNVALCAKQEGRLNRYFPDRQEKPSLIYSTGFYDQEPDRRWSAPTSQLRIVQNLETLKLTIFGSLDQGQTLRVYGAGGQRAFFDLHPSRPVNMCLSALKAGELLHFVSNHAFCPAWAGSDDARLLSFYIAK